MKSLYVFMDESGDLGFSKKSSKWFVFTIAFSTDHRCLERVVKKVWKSLYKKYKHSGELHASHEKEVTRLKMLKLISQCDDLKIMTIILNKDKVYTDLQNQKNYLYNYTANIILDRLHNKDFIEDINEIKLVIDRKDTKKSLQDNFINYLTNSVSKKGTKNFSVKLHASYENKSLQAVDFISWSIFRKYEQGDYKYYEIIKNKIIEEKLLFP